MLTRRFNVGRAVTADDLHDVGAFRYRCYLADGLIAPRPDNCFLDEYDHHANAQVHRVRYDDRTVGTIRLHILDDSHHASATMAAFADILMPKIASGLKLIDGARFAVAPDLGPMRLAVARQTLRIYANHAKANDVHYSVAAVSLDRIPFYERLYGFHRISEPRAYGGLSKPLVLMGSDLRKSRFSQRHVTID
ncbi:hypothetical protein SAMN04488003_11277 [Loktanella fryxellensis]|uniref:N-acyl amino acid synthase FeeM catalytic core domain-containing protein n=1 Tax=Loktanella fryxellensis TaxID=245187 RepID=A0A1H8F7J4_9RHOB|nr:hypothetical protein [Loktanella fryxellensis]SEN27881.1 hypothetical protein SAMN04488003_11277 [Loktanella fryxellensis]